MTLDEAIKRFSQEAEVCEENADNYTRNKMPDFAAVCAKEAAEHRQLASWLSELKELRNSVGAVNLELLKEAQAELEKRGSMLHDSIAELEEAKRLLKLTVEDFSNIYDHIFDCDGICDTCPIHGNRDTCDKWVHADEALKLIGEDETDG